MLSVSEILASLPIVEVAHAGAVAISERELESTFADRSDSDAAQWLDMHDGSLDMTDTATRRRVFASLNACGVSRRLESAGHVVTFSDGSALRITRAGVVAC